MLHIKEKVNTRIMKRRQEVIRSKWTPEWWSLTVITPFFLWYFSPSLLVVTFTTIPSVSQFSVRVTLAFFFRSSSYMYISKRTKMNLEIQFMWHDPKQGLRECHQMMSSIFYFSSLKLWISNCLFSFNFWFEPFDKNINKKQNKS